MSAFTQYFLSRSGPKGVSFEFEPATEYTCNYAVGEFYPRQIPKCVYGKFSLLKILINLFL